MDSVGTCWIGDIGVGSGIVGDSELYALLITDRFLIHCLVMYVVLLCEVEWEKSLYSGP